jgi:hypothetical protein
MWEEGDATVMAADLISRAWAGDSDAFRELTEPYRRELQVHSYRMLGPFPDAEDAMQDRLLAASKGLGGFEERSSLRTWLYRIRTDPSTLKVLWRQAGYNIQEFGASNGVQIAGSCVKLTGLRIDSTMRTTTLALQFATISKTIFTFPN